MSNDWTYGDPDEVAERLMTQNMDDIDKCDIIGALANAMRRIATLERRLDDVSRIAGEANSNFTKMLE